MIIYAAFIFGLAQFVSREKAGHVKNSTDYFLASKVLPWWAIVTSLIADNIDRLVTLWQSAIGPQGGARMTGRGFDGAYVAVLPAECVGEVQSPV